MFDKNETAFVAQQSTNFTGQVSNHSHTALPQSPSLAISAWPEGERPRERLLAKGAESLSDAELLAILLRTGRKGLSAVDLARRLLQPGKGLAWLGSQSPKKLIQQGHLGTVAACSVLASFELGRRLLASKVQERELLSRPHLVHGYLKSILAHEQVECFLALFLDARNCLIEHRELFRGSVRQTAVHPREIVRGAMELNACAVVVAHNHPSGVAEPSAADRAITQAIQAALDTMDIRLLDHIVVSHNQCFSFAANGMMGR